MWRRLCKTALKKYHGAVRNYLLNQHKLPVAAVALLQVKRRGDSVAGRQLFDNKRLDERAVALERMAGADSAPGIIPITVSSVGSRDSTKDGVK